MKPIPKVDIDLLNSYVERRLITRRPHPTADLYVWNYTPIVQFGKSWDEVTTMCRGLITDFEGNIVARGFKKFWNWQEHQGEDSKLPKLPFEDFRVYDKLDGSLGILYQIDGKPYLATRGSFESDQAKAGTKILHEKYGGYKFDPNLSYLFEILVPENRIVVNYGDRRDIVLLAILDTTSGQDVDPTGSYPFPVVESYPMQPLESLLKVSRDNSEGFVIQYQPSGVRTKIKHADYLRLHKLLTNVSNKSIWEALKAHTDMNELLDNVPDEFASFVNQTIADLTSRQRSLLDEATQVFNRLAMSERREIALALKDNKTVMSMVFAMLDGKKELVEEISWKAVRPIYARPFRIDSDEA